MCPDVEMHRVVAGRVRMRALRNTQQRPHERERRDRVPLLLLALRMAERIEASCDNEIRRVDRVHGVRDGVDHPAVRARADRIQIKAHVRLVRDLEDVLGGDPKGETVVVSSESRREVAQVSGIRCAGVAAARVLVVRPGWRRLDLEDRGHAG